MRYRIFHSLGTLFCVFLSTCAYAQDCSQPEQLCGLSPAKNGLLNQNNAINQGCFNMANTLVYSFTTNDLLAPGSAVIHIENIDCLGLNGQEPITAAVVKPAYNPNPCTTANWRFVASCQSHTNSIDLQTESLQASTEYFVLVGAASRPDTLNCSFDIRISGDAVGISACCSTEISLGESVELVALGGDESVGYTWRPSLYIEDPQSGVTLAYPEESITYTVRGSIPSANPNVNEVCAAENTINIVVGPPVTAPNTFTPNNDGINDTWHIDNIQNFENSQVSIYTRWGQLVHKALGNSSDWDGTKDGHFLPTGTYYYVIELNDLDVPIPPITGFVCIIH